MATNPSLDGRAAGRGVEGIVTDARREREGGELRWFVIAILIVAAFFLFGYNERLLTGMKAELAAPSPGMPIAVASLHVSPAPG